MMKRLLTLSMAGLMVVVAGLVVAGFAFNFSKRNAQFLQEGLTREGRVISRHQADPDASSGDFLRVRANLATNEGEVLTRIVEVEVPSESFEETEVGTKIPLLVLPGDPPSVRLKTKTEEASFTTGYLLAAALIVLGMILIWLDRRTHKPRTLRPTRPVRTPALPGSLQKIAIKSTVLYDGPFEFSYAEEKTRIALSDGTSLRINQYRPLADIAGSVPEEDLLEILRTAKSDWKFPKEATAKEVLSQLIKEKQITGADQFFVNRDHLGLLSRSEVNNGRWSSWVRGVWLLSPAGRLLARFLSGNPAHASKAAEEVLYHDNLKLVSALAPHLAAIRDAASGTPDDKRTHLSATRLIEGLKEGKCSCQIYTATTDFSPDLLLAKKKMKKKKPGKKEDQETAHDLACPLCQRVYTVTAKVRSGQAQFLWEEDRSSEES